MELQPRNLVSKYRSLTLPLPSEETIAYDGSLVGKSLVQVPGQQCVFDGT